MIFLKYSLVGLTEPMHDQPSSAQPRPNINNLQPQQGPLQQHQPSTPPPPTTSSQLNNIQQPNTTSTTLQSQILQAFSQPFLKDSAQVKLHQCQHELLIQDKYMGLSYSRFTKEYLLYTYLSTWI